MKLPYMSYIFKDVRRIVRRGRCVQMRLAKIDFDVLELSAYCVESDKGIGFDQLDLHNTRVWIGGHPIVLVVGEPDEETRKLLGVEEA